MAYERHIIAGMTDYTGVSIEDIHLHFRDWLSNTEETIGTLKGYLIKVNQQQALLESPKAVISFIKHFINLFSRYRSDFERLVKEVPTGVRSAHVNLIKQLYESSLREERWIIKFKENWIEKPLTHEDVRPLLDKIYGDTLDMVIDYSDLLPLIPRLKTFIGSRPSSPDAFPELHLKPNIFGLGLNLNRILGRLRDWWHKKD